MSSIGGGRGRGPSKYGKNVVGSVTRSYQHACHTLLRVELHHVEIHEVAIIAFGSAFLLIPRLLIDYTIFFCLRLKFNFIL